MSKDWEDKMEMMAFVEGVSDPKFTEDKYKDLIKKNASAIDTVLKAVLAASGFADEDESKEVKKDLP